GGCECLADCAQPSVIMIHPGGMADLSWTAVVYEPEAMPEECYADPSCAAASCVSPAAAGPLVFFVDGYSELADCSQAICDCDGGESGACIVEGATLVSGTPVAASSPWSPSEGSIGITFQ
ncbi:MAG: hypothetical protein JNK04_24070, partial [Myxococcales bacterium]|nr:hypothetical protein [Myxococcales bacterium]